MIDPELVEGILGHMRVDFRKGKKLAFQNGFWVNRQGELIPIASMNDRYLTNVAQLLIRNAQRSTWRQTSNILNILANPLGLSEDTMDHIEGEIYGAMWEREIELDWEDIIHQHPIWFTVERELKKRGLWDPIFRQHWK